MIKIKQIWWNYEGFLCLMTLPALYERYQHEVDYLAVKGSRDLKKLYRNFDHRFLNKIPRGPVKEKKKFWIILQHLSLSHIWKWCCKFDLCYIQMLIFTTGRSFGLNKYMYIMYWSFSFLCNQLKQITRVNFLNE